MSSELDLLKQLRDITGAGILDCKKYLTKSKNNLDEAVKLMRSEAGVKAEKKSNRIAAEGVVHYFSNTFFNTDIWIHNAEYQLRTRKLEYKLSTSSDISTRLFRKWYKTSGLEDSEFFKLPEHLPEPLPPDKQFDPVYDHNKY